MLHRYAERKILLTIKIAKGNKLIRRIMPETYENRNNISNGTTEKKPEKSQENGLIEAVSDPIIIWNKKIPNTELERFQKVVEKKYNKHFDSYWDFHKWSIKNYTQFWKEVWHFCGVICSKSYEKVLVKTGPGFLDNDWFVGARFNYAENILRNRDDTLALIHIDEQGNEDTVTFAEMFEEVKLYAAAFRKYGLKKGDMVACYMSHRKEAVFAMLAATSIGAIWGGVTLFHGGRFASNLVQIMGAKFLFTIDLHIDENLPEYMLERIPIITDSCPTIENVILLVTQSETYNKDLSNIRNCIFLENFLKHGRNSDGSVPDIVFEQLPFSHPICINITSGTTGFPKAPVHSAGTLVSLMRDFSIHMNMKKGDTICSMYSVGSSVWDNITLSLALGITNLLHNRSLYFVSNGKNFWDTMAKYKINLIFLTNKEVESMYKMGMEPSPDSNLDCLKIVGIIGAPVKKESFLYLRDQVKRDLFVASSYGATEVFGTFSGFNLNMPVYAGEIQAPSLGMDVQCFDEKGNSVIGERGEMVVCTPAPNFPVYLRNDENNTRMKESYLTKYPGVWCQNDLCWINPKTNGLIVIGRSDDVLKQNSERFTSSDIYFSIYEMEELEDYICVGQQRENGDNRAVLFVKMRKGFKFTSETKQKIGESIAREIDDYFIPECIVEVPDIPYNFNKKRLESVVRKIVATNEIPEVMNIRNPESLKHFLNIPEVVSYNLLL